MILSPIQDGCSSSSDVTHECDQSMIFLESHLSTQWWEGRGRAKILYSFERGWRESFVLSWFIHSKGGSLFTRKFVSWYHCPFVPIISLKSWIIQDVTIYSVEKELQCRSQSSRRHGGHLLRNKSIFLSWELNSFFMQIPQKICIVLSNKVCVLSRNQHLNYKYNFCSSLSLATFRMLFFSFKNLLTGYSTLFKYHKKSLHFSAGNSSCYWQIKSHCNWFSLFTGGSVT